MGQRYDVYVTGTFAGHTDPEAAIGAFARFCGLTGDVARDLFDKAPQRVRSDLSEAQTERFRNQLRGWGILSVQRRSGEELVPPGPGGPEGPGESVRSSVAPAQRRPMAFHFSGSGSEYFRIWIVNLLLTIVTLGIYGPWAKVRNRQYLYGNTSLEGESFAYTADPVRLLVGRLIALVFFAVYYYLGTVSPEGGSLAAMALMVAMPWAVNKSLSFNARNSVYRNIRFRFSGDYGQAFIALILWPFAALMTLGLLLPMALQRWKRYTIDRHSYGSKGFQFGARPGSFYRLCLMAFAIAVIAGLGGALLSVVLPPAGVLGLVVGYGLAIVYYSTGIKNLIYNHTSLASHTLSGNFELRGFGWIMVSNFFLVILTLGLYLPWARVRLARYTAGHVVLNVSGDLDQFAAISQEDESAMGEEFSDVFGLDFGF